MFALGCGGSDTGGGGGCGGETATCEIDPDSTVCGDRITVACFDGGTPEAESQCEKALEESGESIYCCASDAETAGAATTDAAAATTDGAATVGAATTDVGAGGTDAGASGAGGA